MYILSNYFFVPYNLFFFVVIRPILEWIIHYFLHKTDNYIHKLHHIAVHRIIQQKLNYLCESGKEKYILALSIGFYLTEYYNLFVSLIYYWIIHNILHTTGLVFPKLYRHHYIHHKYPKFNYGVTTIWVDKLFGTYRDEY